MKIRWSWMWLCVSLVFNVLFIAGYWRAKPHTDHFGRFEHRAKRMAQRLDLNSNQQQAFDQLVKEAIDKRAQRRQEIGSWREKIMAELVKDQPDEAVLQAFMEQGHHRQRREQMIGHMRQLMAILRPEQRQLFTEMIKERWARKSRRF